MSMTRRTSSAGVAALVAICGLVAGLAAAAPAPDVRATASRPVLEDRYPARRVQFPDGVTGLPDLVYSSPPGFRPLTLDLYLPKAAPAAGPKTHALVLYIHGGGWTSGHTRHSGAFENWPGVLAMLAARGYVVSSLNYRLSSEAAFPAAIQDVKAAIRWLRAHADSYGIDKSRVMVWGGSAGGQLAALAATSCEEASLAPPAPATAESDCVQGAVLWYPVTDFGSLTPSAAATDAPSPLRQYLGCEPRSCSAEQLRLASPLQQIGKRTPPMLLVHGDGDRVVPSAQSTQMYAALQKAGIRSDLLVIAGVDHSFIGTTAAATRDASLKALDRSIAFIEETVGTTVR